MSRAQIEILTEAVRDCLAAPGQRSWASIVLTGEALRRAIGRANATPALAAYNVWLVGTSRPDIDFRYLRRSMLVEVTVARTAERPAVEYVSAVQDCVDLTSALYRQGSLTEEEYQRLFRIARRCERSISRRYEAVGFRLPLIDFS